MTKPANDQRVIQLIDQALADTTICADIELVAILRQMRTAAVQGQVFYDDKNQFQPLISRYTRLHSMRTPTVLLKLLRYVTTPQAWSGF
ncbi:bacteriocin immunity protein [Loigolactobacillus binensis]|uniref:Bacteriocin immunity protein n=1 Tax=Loigolactobacillus binensis TaxID=2559922 RepID=A0ABW3EDE5_9LACO|nr:bacteriocin immunity protein [Loigolactobacillus binensis]